jgi:hypothetical protein
MVDTIKFSEMLDGGDIDNNKRTPGLKDDGNVLFNNPWTFLAPGTTAERPPITADIYYRLRINTSLTLYEYYDPIDAMWVQLTPATGSVLSVTGTAHQVSVNNTDPQNPILFLPNDVDFPMTFTVQNTVVINEIIDDDTFATATDTNLPTSESVKAYVDAQVSGSVTSAQGTQFQVLVNGTFGSQETGDVIFSLPQDIDSSASPTFFDLTLFGANIFDENGNINLRLRNVASAVNYIEIFNAITGTLPSIQADGTDTDISINIIPKGDAGLSIQTSAVSATPIKIYNGTAAQHLTNFLFANTANTRNVTFQDATGTVAFLADIPAGSPSALTRTNDTNVTLTLGGTPATALLQAVSLTLGWTGTLSETRGGTAQSTYTLGDTLYASASNTLSKLSGNTTAVKQYLSQTGTGIVSAAPAWATISGSDITGAALTKTDDTNVTMTLGGTPTTALLRAASMTLGWTGQLSLTRGGTNASLTASNGGIVYSTASAMAILSGTATANQMLQSGAGGAPAWSTTTYPSTNAINTIMYASSANVLGSISAANSSVLVTSSTGVPSMSGALTNGQLIIGSTGATPTAATLTAGANISITNGAGSITIAGTGLAGFSWTTVTGTSQAMLSNNGYIANNAGLVTLTLPATSAVGDEIDIIGKGSGGWKVQAGGGQTIVLGSSTTTSGGSLASTHAKDSFYMICTVANTEWEVASAPQSAGLTVA